MMRIDSIAVNPFGGIHQLETTLQPGLNVILGPNEAGKSTLVEALYHGLFQDIRLRKSVRDDLTFLRRAFPYPEGDHAHVEIGFTEEKQEGRLVKHWQEKGAYAELRVSGQVYREEDTIHGLLGAMLRYGAATYSNVVFSRQHQFRQTLERLREDAGTSAAVDQILRRAVMDLDGVSVEALRTRLDEQIDRLGKRWDLAGRGPENNRTIRNPYKTGLGDVLKAYYEMETLRLNVEAAQVGERRIEELEEELQELVRQVRALEDSIEPHRMIRQDVLKRESLEGKLRAARQEMNGLSEVNSQWPALQERANNLGADLTRLETRQEEFEKEEGRARQAQLLEGDRTLLARAESLETRIDTLQSEVTRYDHVTEDDVRELTDWEGTLSRVQAAMDAATLNAFLERSVGPVSVRSGFDEPVVLEPGERMQANGSVRIEAGTDLVVQISAGEIDYETLRASRQEAEEGIRRILKGLGVNDSAEARALMAEARSARQTLNQERANLASLVDGKDLGAIRTALKNLGNETHRPLDVIRKDLGQNTKELQEVRTNRAVLGSQLDKWEQAYGSIDGVLDSLVDLRSDLREMERQMEGLALLPEGFDSAEDFLANLDARQQQRQDLLNRQHEDQLSLERLRHELPAESAEELGRALEAAEGQFELAERKLERLEQIRDTLNAVLKRLDGTSLKPLEERLGVYLGELTENRYSPAFGQGPLQVELLNNLESSPLLGELMSTGTYDTLALAFRLALFDQLFEDTEGFLVLDDCLVNLDPDRRAWSIDLIRQQADRHQILFTTCNPETARDLGGHLVVLS